MFFLIQVLIIFSKNNYIFVEIKNFNKEVKKEVDNITEAINKRLDNVQLKDDNPTKKKRKSWNKIFKRTK